MYQARRLARFAGYALGIALLAALVVEGSIFAQETDGVELQLTPSRDSGVSGTATFEDVEGGVEVTLDMRGLPEPDIEHINHVHAGGTCADDRAGRTAPVTIPLQPVVAQEDGTGTVTTVIDGVTLERLFDQEGERFILLHAEAQEGEGVPPGIACADLVQSAANGGAVLDEETAMMEETTMVDGDLPESGGPSIFLPAAALLVGAGVLSYAVLRRRRM